MEYPVSICSKNTIILRIADVGFVSGSYYTLFEQEILDLIEAKENRIWTEASRYNLLWKL